MVNRFALRSCTSPLRLRACVWLYLLVSAAGLVHTGPVVAEVIPKQAALDAQTFWDNRDWDWYKANIPFFDCPDPDLVTTYYYRWELLTKHLTYGSPNSGYSFTEFIDRPFWSGAYGAISCPAGHQLYEARWLRTKQVAQDYGRYWFRTPGAQPRNYSTWLADAIWAVQQVHPDADYTQNLLPDLVKNYEAWEQKYFVKETGLFWQTGHDDGMEFNINSRQTEDILRGAPAYRPTLNAYMWADASAIARTADLAGNPAIATRYRAKAAALKEVMQKKLWDPKRHFFFPMAKRDEQKEGHTVKALSLTHQTGQFAGDEHGRELMGYVPWQFNMPDAGFESAWKPLTNKDGFLSAYGPSTVERHDPMFLISKTCCWWSGNSWPYATTQTLKGMANLLQNYQQDVVSRADYVNLLRTFAKTHRKAGKPYLAEACHPDTGSWDGHDGFNHSEHYFHSGFIDLVITGLVGLRPRDDFSVEVQPLVPPDWDYFALEDVMYHGHRLSIVWDRNGKKYSLGKGLHIFIDGLKFGPSDVNGKTTLLLPPPERVKGAATVAVNYAVNNDATYYPRMSASYSAPGTSIGKVNDGNYWYHVSPPNRWTCEGSLKAADWCAIDFGTPRTIEEVWLYPLDDGSRVVPPTKIDLEFWDGKAWARVPGQTRTPDVPTGRRANRIRFPAVKATKVRAVFTHGIRGKTGLTEFEVWGPASLPVEPAPPPKGNLAYNPGDKAFPKASASFTSRFDQPERANDGKVSFNPNPANRWTTYDSPNATDWLEIDFGAEKPLARIELAIYDDRGGVQAPASYDVQVWDGTAWKGVAGQKKSPEKPAGGEFNTVAFPAVKTSKFRVVFTHNGKARSGVSEVFAWSD